MSVIEGVGFVDRLVDGWAKGGMDERLYDG